VFYLKVKKNCEKAILSCDIAKKSASQHYLTCHIISFFCTGLPCPKFISGSLLTICLGFRAIGSGNEEPHFTKARERGDQLFPPTRQQQLLWGWKTYKNL